jgi:hypothetical protein
MLERVVAVRDIENVIDGRRCTISQSSAWAGLFELRRGQFLQHHLTFGIFVNWIAFFQRQSSKLDALGMRVDTF